MLHPKPDWPSRATERVATGAERTYARRMLEDVTSEILAAHLGQPFVPRPAEAEPLELSLAEVRPLGKGRPGAARDPFALLFRGPTEPVMPQATYRLAREGIGELDVFLVPVALTAESADYEAVFT